jgi:hypothetical protein
MARADGIVADVVSSNVAVLARDLMPRLLVIEAGGEDWRPAVLGEHEQKLRGDELVHELPLKALQATCTELHAKQCDHVLLAHAARRSSWLAQETRIFNLVVASGENNLPSLS